MEKELAEVHLLPSAHFLTIEYPGYVVNQDRAIRTLGGMKTVNTVMAVRPLQLAPQTCSDLSLNRTKVIRENPETIEVRYEPEVPHKPQSSTLRFKS